ncbi:MAG TPA: ECF transporter S component [Acholeplasmataceae bacterium]|jgi:ECF transporter S component (folate family)|nr:ECF transporter S component [Acholeplasmataceae bacterium]
MQKKELYKIVLGGILTALAVGIRLFFDYVFPMGSTSGLPIYSIPLVIASLTLGPFYGLLVGITADLGMGLLGPYDYMPLFGISTIVWAVVPGLIARKNYNFLKMALAVIVSYLLASFSNTLAIIVYFDSKTALASFAVRIPVLVGTSPALIYLDHLIYSRILDYQNQNELITE